MATGRRGCHINGGAASCVPKSWRPSRSFSRQRSCPRHRPRHYNLHNADAPYDRGDRIGPGWDAIKSIAGADVNQDGYVDIVATKPDGTMSVCYDTTFNMPCRESGTPFGSGWTAVNRWGITNVCDPRQSEILTTTDRTLWGCPYTGDNGRPYNDRHRVGHGW